MSSSDAELIDLLDEERDIRTRLGFHARLVDIHIRVTELTQHLAGRPS